MPNELPTQTIRVGDLAMATLMPGEEALAESDSKAGKARVAKEDLRKALRFIIIKDQYGFLEQLESDWKFCQTLLDNRRLASQIGKKSLILGWAGSISFKYQELKRRK